MENLNPNRNHKDSVFISLFSETNNLLELYNAISGQNYPKGTEIKVITLSDVLYRKQYNDICFLLDNKFVVLMEHQSTINENICLRMLSYIPREYERITNSKDLYREKRIKIPAPEFIVLYNGRDEFPDYKEMRLSDSYEFKGETCFLELLVNVYNINKGRNAEMASRSPALEGYETFIAEVRKNSDSMDLSEAIRFAIKSCISENILVSFLREKGSEVENMLYTEFNMEDALAVRYEEGIATGQENKEKEKKEVREETLFQTAKSMLDDGIELTRVARITNLTEKQIMDLKKHKLTIVNAEKPLIL